MSRYNIKLQVPRDHEILMYIWKWKVSTTAQIAKKFFKSVSVQSAYRRLMKMKKANLIETRCLDHDGGAHVWVLRRSGFEVIQRQLPPLKERGFKSEFLSHDLIVSAFHQGGQINDQKIAKTISEQQLRRIEDEFLEVDENLLSSLHRPDGISKIGSFWYAFEAELSIKRSTDYELIGEYYEDRGYKNVFWLVPRKSYALRIFKHLNANSNQEMSIHKFYLYKDFIKIGWNAPEILSDNPLGSITTILGEKPDNACIKAYKPCGLDIRKYPVDPKACKILKVAGFSD